MTLPVSRVGWNCRLRLGPKVPNLLLLEPEPPELTYPELEPPPELAAGALGAADRDGAAEYEERERPGALCDHAHRAKLRTRQASARTLFSILRLRLRAQVTAER